MKTMKMGAGFIRKVARENGVKFMLSDIWIKSAHKYAKNAKNQDEYWLQLKEFFTTEQ